MSTILLLSCITMIGRQSFVSSPVTTAGCGSSDIILKNGQENLRNILKTRKSVPSEDRRMMSACGWSKGSGAREDMTWWLCWIVPSISTSLAQIPTHLTSCLFKSCFRGPLDGTLDLKLIKTTPIFSALCATEGLPEYNLKTTSNLCIRTFSYR